MLGDDPPYLSVGTEVSAKYKGAFCEAKIRKVVRSVKCRVTYKQGLGTATVADDQIKGTLRVGASVEARHSEKKDFIEATITKIQDCSQYTVVFDDGDITTLRRTALCLKSGRHFAESETLDQLPLTHPEHFGNPVIGGRRGRRSRQAQDDSSEDEGSPPRGSPSGSGVGGKEGVETEPEIGRVVCVELGDKKKKDYWFPGLVVAPTAQDTVRIRVRDDYLVRSFKDARYYTVPKKEAIEFTKELGLKVENSAVKVAVEKALLFLEKNELPPHWDRDSLFGNTMSSGNSDSDADLDSDSSDDEPREEKDHFVAQLYKFMDDRGTPINNCPMIGTEDLDLYRLFRAVYKLGGYNRVTNQSRWKSVTRRLGISMQSTPATHNLVKQAYKKFLHSFEDFYRKLGCTMVAHPRGSTRKPRPGRSLIRDKDRNTPVPTAQQLIPKLEKVEDEEKKPMEEEKREQPVKEPKQEPKLEEVKIKKEEEPTSGQESDVNIEGESAESSSSEKSQKPARFTPIPLPKAKPKKEEPKKKNHEKRKEPSTPSTTGSSKKKESEKKEEEAAKTRSKAKEDPKKEKTERETRTPSREPEKRPNSSKQRRLTEDEMKKQRGRKKREDMEKPRETEETGSESAPCYKGPVQHGDRLKVYYGPTHESKVTYEAKVIGIQRLEHDVNYLVHYTGWNTRYDEWIKATRIAQNFTQSQSRMKRTKTTPRPQTPSTTSSKTKPPSSSVQSRRRAQSVAPTTSKLPSTSSSMNISSTANNKDKEPARSTTPLSVASSSSRTKSPATPAGSRPTRGARNTEQTGVEFRRRTRRMSGHTDLSVATESEDSEAYETDTTEPERARTRSRGTEERRRRDVRRRVEDRIKPDENSEGEDEKEPSEPRRTRRLCRTTNKATKEARDEDDDDDDEADEDDNEDNDEDEDEEEEEEEVREAFERVHGHDEQPKGRDFDLNQIRSELKGFDKAVKMEVIRMEPENSGDEDVKPNIEDIALEIKEEKIDLPEDEGTFEDKPMLETTKPGPPSLSPTEDVYEFKEPEPFEFEVRNKRDSSGDKDKSKKRVFDDEQQSKSPKKKRKISTSPQKESDTESKRKKKVKKAEESPEGSPTVSSKVASPQPPSPAAPKEPEKIVDVSPTKVAVASPPPTAPIVTEETKTSESVNLFFSEAPETEDTVGEPDDPEDRLVISETEVTEIESENPFAYVAEMYPGPVPDKTEFTTEVDIKEENEPQHQQQLPPPLPLPSPPQSSPQPVITAVLASSIVAPVIATNLPTTPPTLERKLMEAKLSTIASLTASLSTPLIPAPISARLPATSTIEEKLSAMAYRHMKPKDSRREDDESRKGMKESQKKAEAKRTKIPDDMTKKEEKKKEEETVKLEEERLREVTRVIKVTEEELELVKTRKEVELKKSDVKIKREEDWPELDEVQLEDLKEAEKRRKKILSQEFVDSTDSSDSEQKLVIEDGEQEVKFEASNFDVKLKAELDLLQGHSDDPALLEGLQSPLLMDTKIIISIKNEEEGENMNLLCEEEIPGSPAPPLDASDPDGSRNHRVIKEEPVEKKILLVEMPFASAPTSGQSTSAGLGLATTSGVAATVSLLGNVIVQRQELAHMPIQAPRRESNEAAPVMDNTPPTTPDSTISNISVSPREERISGSPLSEENGKNRESSEGDNDSGGKGPSLYSEDDVPNADSALERATKGCKRPLDDPALLKKRKRSRKNSECGSNAGKKPARQSTRQTRTGGNGNGSDSDDNSEASSNHGVNNPVAIVPDNNANGMTDLSTRITPKPTKYNFYVELDPELDGGQRIAVLQQKLTDLKKTYNAVKIELAAIERRRKKLRRREREAMKAAKAEMQQACA